MQFRRLARWSSLGVVVLVAVGCKPSAILVDGSDCTGAELSIAADTLDIDGNVHSNGDISLDATGTIEGRVSGAGSIDLGDMTLDPTTDNPQTTGTRPWPDLPELSDYEPGGVVAVDAAAQGAYFDHSGGGEVVLAGALPAGVHYTDGDLVVTGSGQAGVTLVAGGAITISGGGLFVPWSGEPDDVLAFSNDDSGCDGNGIHITFDCTPNGVHGALVAPGSGILLDGTPDAIEHGQKGRLAAHHVDIALTGYHLEAGPPPTGLFEAVGCSVG